MPTQIFIKTIFIGLILLALPSCLFAQSPDITNWNAIAALFKARKYEQIIDIADVRTETESNSKAIAYATVWRGRCMFRLGKYSETVQELTQAIKLLGQPTDSTQLAYQAFAYNDMGNALLPLSEREAALEAFEKAVAIRTKILGTEHTLVAGTYINISNIYDSRGEYETALRYVNQARTIRTKLFGKLHPSLNNIYYKIGQIYLHQGYYEDAISYLDTTRQIRISAYGYYHPQVSAVLGLIGGTYIRLGDLRRALNYHQQNLKINLKTLGNEHLYTAGAYGNIGQVFLEMGEPDSAYYYLIKSYDIKQPIFDKETEDLAITYNNLGIVETQRGNYIAAQEWLERAKVIHQEINEEKSFLIMDNDFNLAHLFYEKKDYARSITAFQTAIDVGQRIWGNQHPTIANCYHGLAKVAIARQNFAQAIEWNQTAENALFSDKITSDTDTFAQALSLPILFKVYLQRIAIDQSQFENSRKNKFAKRALANILEADRLVEYQRTSYKELSSYLLVNKNAKELYARGLQLCMALFRVNKDEKLLELAFDFMEKSKAQQLLTSLNATSQSLNFADVYTTLLQEEKILHRQLNQLSTEIFNAQNDSLKQILQQQHFLKQEEYYTLLQTLETDYPNYYQLKYQPKKIDLATAQAALNKQSTMLQYFISDSLLYILTINKKTVNLNEIDLPADFKMQLSNFLLQLHYDKKEKDLQSLCTNLSTILISQPLTSLSKTTQRLTIIPDGLLGYIPFEILFANVENEYLLRHYTISYAYSTTLLQLQNQLKKQHSAMTFGGFAPNYQSLPTQQKDELLGQEDITYLVRSGNYHLPGAQYEVEQIAEILNGSALINEQATEANFKSRAADFSILHLSMHSLFNDQDPLYSNLLFTPTVDSLEDGSLYAAELYNMSLNADLVVLSACNTGIGKLEKGEGIMSLSRAFTYTGVPATVMGLWQVPDRSTTTIMIDFYKYLQAGYAKDEALRQAKIDYLDDTVEPLERHPYFWAGFVPVGNMQPLDLSNSWDWQWILLLFIAVILTGWLIRKIS